MKTLRSVCLIAVIAVLCGITLSGCLNKTTIVGSYNMGGDANPGIMRFSPDGLVSWSQPYMNNSGTGTWELQDDVLTIRTGRYLLATYRGSVRGNPLWFSLDGPINYYDSYGDYQYTADGTVTFSRRFLGLFNALSLDTKAKNMKNADCLSAFLSAVE